MNRDNIKLELLSIDKTDTHLHDRMECILVVAGTLDIDIENRRTELKQDDIIVINPNQIHTIYRNSNALILSFFSETAFMMKECGEFYNGYILCNSHEDIGKIDKKYFDLKRALIKMKIIEIEKEYGYEFNLHILSLRFLYDLIMYFGGSKKTDNFEGLKSNAELSLVLSYIQKNYHQPVSLKEAADLIYMSPYYFSKFFKKKMGVGFLQYLQKIRMEYALNSLLTSGDSISRIALNSGFPSQKAFLTYFKKIYGETPSVYRLKHKTESVNKPQKIFEINKDNGVTEFLKIIKRYNVYSNQFVAFKKIYDINLGSKGIKKRKTLNNILNIGKIDVALRSNFTENLRNKKDLGLKYVYFMLPLNEIRIGDKIIEYDMLYALEIFEHNELIPIVSLCCGDILFEDKLSEEIEIKLIPLLKIINKRFSKRYLSQWMFEIVLEKSSAERAHIIFRQFYLSIKKILPSFSIGMSSISNDTAEEKVNFHETISFVVNEGLRPDFITLRAFANDSKLNYMPDIKYYPLKGYHEKMAGEVKQICDKYHLDIPIYMIDWNTITGASTSEINVYYRSALILDALLETNHIIDGAGFWFDTALSHSMTREVYATSLSLYIFKDSRRPVYFVLETLTRLGNDIILTDENILVACSENEEIIILVWNPVFLNPVYCLDEAYTQRESKKNSD